MADIASDDVTRYNLQRVRVERTDKGCTLTATNGHILAHVEIEDAGIVAELTAGMPHPVAYLMPDDASKRASVQAPLAWEVEGKGMGYWPDYKQVIPSPRADKGGSIVGLSASYLVTIGRCAERLAKAGGDKTAVMLRMETQDDPWGPVRWTATLGDIRFLAVQMPMRL